jgi:flagellar biogenesis protein FliO
MSWIRTTFWLALTSVTFLAQATAQTPQLAPQNYGPNDGVPRSNNDLGPQPTLAPPPLGSPAVNDDSREYLRLLNQPAAVSNPTPAPASSAPANPGSLYSNTAVPLNSGANNNALRPETTATAPNMPAAYQLPAAQAGVPAVSPHGTVPGPSPPKAAPINVPATYNLPQKNENLNNEPRQLETASNAPRPLPASGAKPLPLAGPNAKTSAAASSWSSFGTMLGSLAIVLGLFVVTIKLLRRGMPAAKQKLGRDVVEVLGQTPLAPRQSLQVIRFGNKILLVAMSPDGCDTLTEITDPLEVDRLAGMCQQAQPNSSTKTFGDMFRQVTSILPALNESAAPTPPSDSILDEVRARLRGNSATNREVPHG